MAASLNNRIKRTKRGKGGKREESLKIFSTNAAGLKNKLQSFKNELNHTNAGIFTIQETHFKKKGMLKINGFDIFEAIRDKQKGGTMIGIHHSLNPMLIKEYSDDFELLVVEIQIADHSLDMVLRRHGVSRIVFHSSLLWKRKSIKLKCKVKTY